MSAHLHLSPMMHIRAYKWAVNVGNIYPKAGGKRGGMGRISNRILTNSLWDSEYTIRALVILLLHRIRELESGILSKSNHDGISYQHLGEQLVVRPCASERLREVRSIS